MKLALVCLLASQALTAPSSSKDMEMRAASCKCGVQGGANRIVGGVEAKVNEFPWIASMSLNVSYSKKENQIIFMRCLTAKALYLYTVFI